MNSHWSVVCAWNKLGFSDGHSYSTVGFENTLVSLLNWVMFPTQEFCSMVCIAFQFVVLCYLMNIYRAVSQLGLNHQQLTEARERSNRERKNRSDIADLLISRPYNGTRWTGSKIDIKLCRLEKGQDGNKAYAISIQAQWDEEKSMFSNRGMVLQGSLYYNNYRYCMILHQCHAAYIMSFIPR